MNEKAKQISELLAKKHQVGTLLPDEEKTLKDLIFAPKDLPFSPPPITELSTEAEKQTAIISLSKRIIFETKKGGKSLSELLDFAEKEAMKLFTAINTP